MEFNNKLSIVRDFDSHIHLNSESLECWWEKNHGSYSSWILNNVSTNLEDLRKSLEQSSRFENVFSTIGIHPLEIEGLSLEEVLEEMERNIGNPKVIAIGEIGLDFYRVKKEDSFEEQKKWVVSQLELAEENDLPVVLHVRNAHREMLDILKGRKLSGIVHCFEGGLEIAKEYLGLEGSWMLSISPTVFRDNSETKGIIRELNIQRLLVETDAPFLCKNNEKVIEIVRLISKEKEMEENRVREILWNNFYDFFKLKLKGL